MSDAGKTSETYLDICVLFQTNASKHIKGKTMKKKKRIPFMMILWLKQC